MPPLPPKINLPLVEPAFNCIKVERAYAYYKGLLYDILSTMLEGRIIFYKTSNPTHLADQRNRLHSLFPLVSTVYSDSVPGCVSFFVISKCRIGAFKFFFDMVRDWLLPGSRRNVSLHFAIDFRFPEFGDDIYSLCEVMLPIDTPEELAQIQLNFPIIESELRMGISSSYYARRILEVKGLAADEKTALIQESISYLAARLPEEFDQDVLAEMQHMLITCSEEFKALRSVRHLARIISIHHLFRKSLREAVNRSPNKRFIHLKLFRTRLKNSQGSKMVLGVIVGVNFFRDNEVFEKAHILKALQNYIPSAQVVENSFFANRSGSEHICTIYLEVEKAEGKEFSDDEIKMLRKKLPSDLKDSIEHLMPPIFMPRNEEEIMRNILSLSNQIKYLRDIPQVFISFDEQTHNHLFFTIILVRVLKTGSISIQKMFENSDSFLEYIHDRSQNAGILRRRYMKEATVFHLKLKKDLFLRANHSIDLNKARQTVISELCSIVGEVRDFNGGMITKQNEALNEIKGLLQNNIAYNDLLLENFFYSLTPVIMRNVLASPSLHALFLLLLETIDSSIPEEITYLIKTKRQNRMTHIVIKTENFDMKDQFSCALYSDELNSLLLVSSYVSFYDLHYLGFIFRSDDELQEQQIHHTIQNIMSACSPALCS